MMNYTGFGRRQYPGVFLKKLRIPFKTSISIASVQADIRTEDLPDTI
jgi:hypothetical protein